MRRHPDQLPAGALPLSTANIWSVIRSQKDLNLPAHKVGAGAGGDEVVRTHAAAAAAGCDSCMGLRAPIRKGSCPGGVVEGHPSPPDIRSRAEAPAAAPSSMGPLTSHMSAHLRPTHPDQSLGVAGRPLPHLEPPAAPPLHPAHTLA